jgi:phosphatidylserine decarboxylase
MDALFIFLQKVAPQTLLSRIAGVFAESRLGWWKNLFIRSFVNKYNVDLGEAEKQTPEEFENFNAFFTRALKADARRICPGKDTLACPADGVISQIGDIKQGDIFQAKGKSYSALTLLGGDESLARKFHSGKFVTVYLSPKDYHRVHTPLDAVLKEMLHVPGQVFSVNTVTAAHIPGLFARNERAVAMFETTIGPMAVVLVGAMIVASIETVWAGLVAPSGNTISRITYDINDKIELEKGSELGRFKLGSTVILLLPENTLEWEPSLVAGCHVRMGQTLGRINPGLL